MYSPVLALAIVLAGAAPNLEQPGPPAQPTPQHKRLEFFIGKWKGEAREAGSPSAPTGAALSCEWFEGGFYVVCQGESVEAGHRTKELDVLGYDAGRHVYTRYSIGSFGVSGFATAKLDGNVWQWQGGFSGAPQAPSHARFPWTETSPDSFTFRIEVSEDGKSFKTVGDGKMVRVK